MIPTYKNIEGEFSEIAAIHAQSFNPAWSKTSLVTMLENQQYSGSLILQNDQVIGFIICSTVLDEAEIISIAIEPAQRDHKYATHLLIHEIKRLKKLAIYKIFLEVNVANIAAIKLYQANGFTQNAIRKNYYKLADGTRADALIFSLDIE